MLGQLGGPRLFADAAKSRLAPLGCRRVGRSGLWIADQRFWAIVITFQRSRFGGDLYYLDVGATWHWHAKEFWSRDYGIHGKASASYWDDRKFAPLARELASSAADQVIRLRNELKSIQEIARLITQLVAAIRLPAIPAAAPTDSAVVQPHSGHVRIMEIIRPDAQRETVASWPEYHAAVATGLAGDIDRSARFFEQIIAGPAATDWQVELRSECARLLRLLPDMGRFRDAIRAIVEESRVRHKLSPDPGCLDNL
jgi:hypothetical protein